ncbi:hypothetical protein BDV26DRAFT_35349 [Aspergillus bertholletiae]|uniref:Cyanovirin-N domain-containing protein n=1 Tax=Aspergillus bertholletiae TaxID=1226010 RepID=A0A5N7AXY8_9EURO|nr:hypothetical protein BDV26DRAFT_35349 [Aspergillus bertholletiae]
MYWLFLFSLVVLAAGQGNNTLLTERGMKMFPGERQHMLEQCDVVWIIGTRPSLVLAPPSPQRLWSECKEPKTGEIIKGFLHLDKCLGWDSRRHQFIAKKNGNGLTRQNGFCVKCWFNRVATGDNVSCLCVNVPDPKPHWDMRTHTWVDYRSFNLDGVVELGNEGLLRCHGINGERYLEENDI